MIFLVVYAEADEADDGFDGDFVVVVVVHTPTPSSIGRTELDKLKIEITGNGYSNYVL